MVAAGDAVGCTIAGLLSPIAGVHRMVYGGFPLAILPPIFIDEPLQIESGAPADTFGGEATMTKRESFDEQPFLSVTTTV